MISVALCLPPPLPFLFLAFLYQWGLLHISEQRWWYWFNLMGCLSTFYTSECRVCCGFSSWPGWGGSLMPATHFHHRCWTFIKCFSRVYLSMTLCLYAWHVISDIIGFQTWSQHHVPGACSNLSWCAIIFIQPCILFAANLFRILCLCRDRNSLPLSLLMMSSFSSNIRVMLPSSKKLGNVLSLFCSICVKLVLFNVWKNSAVKPSGLKFFFFVGRFLN